MNEMDFQVALKSYTVKLNELAEKIKNRKSWFWDDEARELADEQRKVIADFKNFVKENCDHFPDDYYEALVNRLNNVHAIGDDFDNDEDEEF